MHDQRCLARQQTVRDVMDLQSFKKTVAAGLGRSADDQRDWMRWYTMARKKFIKLFIVSFVIQNERVYWDEALSADDSFALAKQLAKQGRKPVVTRVCALPSSLLSCASKVRKQRVA